MREEPRDFLVWIPLWVSVRWDFMIAKDPHVYSAKGLPQEQCLRDHVGAAGIIRALSPEYQDFIPPALVSASIPAGPSPLGNPRMSGLW
jgi:hypothetical protein